MLAPWKKSYDQSKQHIKKQRYCFANKGPYSQSYGFSGSHICMWELDHKEGWALKNQYFWTVVLKKTPESPLDNKEIKLVNLKWNQPWTLVGRTMLKLKLQYFCHLMQTTDSLEQFLMLAKIDGRRRRESIRGWDGWMASPVQWTWTWVNFGRWWGTEKPGVLQSMGSQRIRRDWPISNNKVLSIKPQNTGDA